MPRVTLFLALLMVGGAAIGAADVTPSSVKEIVVRPSNNLLTTSACGADGEVQFIGFSVPKGQVLMLKGVYFGAGTSTPGELTESVLYVTDGNPNDMRYVAPLAGITSPASGSYAGLETLPLPVPSMDATFTHLCWHRTSGIIGTSPPWLFGFFAPEK